MNQSSVDLKIDDHQEQGAKDQKSEEVHKRSPFALNRYTELSPIQRMLNRIKVESLVVLVLLAVLVLKHMHTEEMVRRVEYQPVAYAAGSMQDVAQPDDFPMETIGLFTRDYLSKRYGFSFLTAERNFKDLEPLIDPRKLLASRDRLETALSQIKALQMHSIHQNLGLPSVKNIEGQNAYIVEQKAFSKMFHGSSPRPEEIRYYSVTLQKGAASPLNPMGLYVVNDPYETESDRRIKELDDFQLDENLKRKKVQKREANSQARERLLRKTLINQ